MKKPTATKDKAKARSGNTTVVKQPTYPFPCKARGGRKIQKSDCNPNPANEDCRECREYFYREQQEDRERAEKEVSEQVLRKEDIEQAKKIGKELAEQAKARKRVEREAQKQAEKAARAEKIRLQDQFLRETAWGDHRILQTIFDTNDLSSELSHTGIDFKQVAYQVAIAVKEQKHWTYANILHTTERDRLKGFHRMRKARDKKKAPERRDRASELSKYTKAIATCMFATEEAQRIKRSTTKDRPFFGLFLMHLDTIFQKADDPYRFMAAIVNLFGLRSENPCKGCTQFKKGRCTTRKIFSCPYHETTRHSIWQQTKAARERHNYLKLSERLADPGNCPCCLTCSWSEWCWSSP